MRQRVPIVFAQVKASNISKNLFNDIRQIIRFLYWAKKITKKVSNSIMNSIKLLNKIDTIFMNSKYSKTSGSHRLLLNLSDKIDLNRREMNILLHQILAYAIHWKNIKKTYKNNKFKISGPTRNENLNYLTDSILYQIFMIILIISTKTWNSDW